MTKKDLLKLQEKMITFEHGKPPKGYKPPYWSCDCWSLQRIRELIKVVKPFIK
jgi:hypothetical protein